MVVAVVGGGAAARRKHTHPTRKHMTHSLPDSHGATTNLYIRTAYAQTFYFAYFKITNKKLYLFMANYFKIN